MQTGQTESFHSISNADMKLGAGDNEGSIEIGREDNIVNETDQFDNTNDSILDDIEETEELDENTSEEESTSEESITDGEESEEIEIGNDKEDQISFINLNIEHQHSKIQANTNESNSISKSNDTLKVIQSDQSRTNLSTIRTLHQKAFTERPREYISLLGPESFIKSDSMMETGNIAKITERIGFIGGGNMAKAIFDGITNKKLINTEQVYVAGPHIDRLSHFKEKGAKVTECNDTLVKLCDVIFICVKPHMLSKIAHEVNCASIELWESKIFVSVLAATSIEKIEGCFIKPMKLIRVMPNTPLAVGEGCCVFTPNLRVDASNIALVRTLLESSGLCLVVPESQINAMASISGSGPAFMYLIMESMADGGVKMGVPRPDAIKLAAQTMLGAAKMVLDSGKHSAQLKDEVCSAGGTTIAGMHALEKGGVRSAMIDAVEAATKRAREMGQ